MRVTEVFKAIEKPIFEFDPEELRKYLVNLYGNENFAALDKQYLDAEQPSENIVNSYRDRTDRLIAKFISLAQNNKLSELNLHFHKNVQKGLTRETINNIKTTVEMICYRLENRMIASPQKFFDELNNAIIDHCESGALTNVQNILNKMNDSYYFVKYDYISKIATEYRMMNIISYNSMEVHEVNELIHEVSRIYNVYPREDLNARYRDLDSEPNELFLRHFGFREYLEKQLNSRIGVYGFLSVLINDNLSSIAFAQLDKEYPYKKILNNKVIGDSQEFEMVEKFAESLKLTLNNLIEFNEDYTAFRFLPSYMSVVNAAVTKAIIEQGFIEHEILYEQKQDGAKNAIIETVDGWYSIEESLGLCSPTKILDTAILQTCSIEGENFEDFLHDSIKPTLEQGINFNTAIQQFLKDNLKDLIITKHRIEESLFLLSDQAGDLKTMLSSTNFHVTKEDIRIWIECCYPKPNYYNSLLFIAKKGNEKLLQNYFSGIPQVLQYLKEEFVNNHKTTLLHMAATHDNHNLINFLGRSDLQDLNIKNEFGDTALNILAYKANIEDFVFLFNQGASLEITNNEGDHAIGILASKENGKILLESLIQQGMDNDVVYSWLAFIQTDNSKKLEYIIKYGDGLMLQKLQNEIGTISDYESILLESIANNNTKLVSYLINQKKEFLDLGLFHALKLNNIEIFDLLINEGANILTKNKGNQSLLQFAVIEKIDQNTLNLLLTRLNDIDQQDNKGNTALHLAIIDNNISAFDVLMQNNADPKIQNKNGYGAIELAIIQKNYNAFSKLAELDLINSNDNTVSKLLYLAVAYGNTEVIDYYVAKGVDLELKDSRGKTLLQRAIEVKNIAAIGKLIILGADLDIVDINGKKPLLLAKDIIPSIAINLVHSLNKKDEDLVKIMNKIIEKASGWVQDVPENWKLIEKMVEAIPIEKRPIIISHVAKNINGDSRKEKLINMLPENEIFMVRKIINPTYMDRILGRSTNEGSYSAKLKAEKQKGPQGGKGI
jgi:ankyrin repeat protein